MSHCRAGRIRAEIIARFPIIPRPDRAWTKTAAAIRTNIAEDGFDARLAECAFKTADHRLRGFGRKRFTAVLAIRSKLKHRELLMFCGSKVSRPGP